MGEYTARAEKLLAEAAVLIAGDRQKDYGPPSENFALVSRLWNLWLHARGRAATSPVTFLLTAADVAAMMMLLKIARLARTPDHHDSMTDIAAYAALMKEVGGSVEPSGGANGRREARQQADEDGGDGAD